MTTTSPTRLDLDTVDPFMTPCPSWCVLGPHGFQSFPEDRSHTSEQLDVPLEFEHAYRLDDEEVFELETATATIHQDYRATGPYLELGRGESAGMKLTPVEARRVAQMLLEVADIADGVTGLDNVERPVGMHVTVAHVVDLCTECGGETRHECVSVYDEDGNSMGVDVVCMSATHHRVDVDLGGQEPTP